MSLPVVPPLQPVLSALLHAVCRGQEVRYVLLAVSLVRHGSHYGGCRAGDGARLLTGPGLRGGVGVEYDVGAGQVPVPEVREEREHPLGLHARLAVVALYVLSGGLEGALHGAYLTLLVLVQVHVDGLFVPAPPQPDLVLAALGPDVRGARVLAGDVLRLAQPGEGFGVLPRPLRLCGGGGLLLQQLLVPGVQLVGQARLRVDGRVDEVNGDP